MEKFQWSLKNGEIDDVRRFVEEDGVDVNMVGRAIGVERTWYNNMFSKITVDCFHNRFNRQTNRQTDRHRNVLIAHD